MRSLSECSGPWTGFFVQESRRGWMKLNLSIDSTRIVGQGDDMDGPFRMFGTHDSVSLRVEIDKAYPWLFVDYVGVWDGSMISGHWEIIDDAQGEFELWPLDSEEEVMKLSELFKSVHPELVPAR